MLVIICLWNIVESKHTAAQWLGYHDIVYTMGQLICDVEPFDYY